MEYIQDFPELLFSYSTACVALFDFRLMRPCVPPVAAYERRPYAA